MTGGGFAPGQIHTQKLLFIEDFTYGQTRQEITFVEGLEHRPSSVAQLHDHAAYRSKLIQKPCRPDPLPSTTLI